MTEHPAAPTNTDESAAEYVRHHQCWQADPNVTIADWHRGILAIESEARAAARKEVREAIERIDCEKHGGLCVGYGHEPECVGWEMADRLRDEVILMRAVVTEAVAHIKGLTKNGPSDTVPEWYGAQAWLNELPRRLPKDDLR